MDRTLGRFVDFLIAYRWALFALGVVIAALAYWPSRGVRFDRSIERMFAARDPLLPPYQRLKQDFGGNEIVMAVYHDEGLLAEDGSGLARLSEISGRIKQVAGVRDVLSLAEVNKLLEQLNKAKKVGTLFSFNRPKDEWTGPAVLDPKSALGIRFRELFAGYTHSPDGKTAALVCMLEPAAAAMSGDGRDPRTKTIAAMDAIVRVLPGGLAPGVLAGEPVMVSEGFALLERDGQRLGTWTMVLMGVTVLLLFRSLRWLLLPLAVVQWALIVTRAALALLGQQLSMVSSMLTAMVTVVGVAGVMHLIVEIREARVHGLSQREALRKMGVVLAGPILAAVLTDVSGFGSLWAASVEPVRDFGTMMVIGTFLVLPAICLLAPALTLAFERDRPTQRGWGEVSLGYWLVRSIDALHARPKTVAAVTSVVAIVASLGAVRLETETDFTRNFRGGSRIVRAYDFVERELGGAGVWDVIVPAPDVLDAEYVVRVRRLEERLRQIEIADTMGNNSTGLTKVLSVVDAIDAVDADPTLAALSPSAELRYQGMKAAMPTFMAALRSAGREEDGDGKLRIMLRAAERQPAEQKRRLIDEVARVAREEFPEKGTGDRGQGTDNANGTGSVPTTEGAEVTGFFVLLTHLIESILRDQWTTFAISSLAIFLMVWIGYRSWRYALISMIPNAVPIYVVMGLLGWAGLKMNMGAAMIAAVSMGMSVDSSMHYFSAFRRERGAGKSIHEALVACQQSVGLAMIFTTVALIVGFGVLITSEFVPTIYFGALMSLAMVGGMLGNLIVLPLLLWWTEK